MTRTFGKLALVLVFGLIAAAALPVVRALEAHRQDRASVLGARQVAAERGASASWMEGLYRFEIIERTIQDQDGRPVALEGYAVAWKASCDGGVCTPVDTWRADLTVEGEERTIVTFDGLGRAAAFSGLLYDQVSGQACRFDVQWGGSRQTAGVVTGDAAGGYGADRVSLTGEPRTLRVVDRVHVAAPTCWPTGYQPAPFAGGSGSIFTAGA